MEWVTIPFPRGIFPTQGSNVGLPHCRQTLHYVSHQGSPGALGWPPKMERRWGWGCSTEGSTAQGRREGNWQIQIPLHHCHPNLCGLQSLQERKVEGPKDMSRTTDVAWPGPHSPARMSALTPSSSPSQEAEQ